MDYEEYKKSLPLTKLIVSTGKNIMYTCCPNCHVFVIYQGCDLHICPVCGQHYRLGECQHKNYHYRNHGGTRVCDDCGKWGF